MRYKIMSFNVREWPRDLKTSSPYYWRKRVDAIRRCIDSEKPDIICLQEALYPMDSMILKGSNYKKAGFGVHHCTLVRKDFNYSDSKFLIHLNGVSINRMFQVINVHSHWDEDILTKNCNQVMQYTKMPCIACGDWNNGLPAIKSHINNMESAREILDLPMEETFQNFEKENSHGELDHFMVTPGIKPISYKVINYNYGVLSMSDHRPIVMEFELENPKKDNTTDMGKTIILPSCDDEAELIDHIHNTIEPKPYDLEIEDVEDEDIIDIPEECFVPYEDCDTYDEDPVPVEPIDEIDIDEECCDCSEEFEEE